IGVACVVASMRLLRESRDEERARVDLAGFVTFSAGLFALVLGLLRGNDWHWTSGRELALFAAAAALLLAFVAVGLGPREPLLGAGLGLVGLSLLLMHGISPGSRWTALLPGFLVGGIGVGMVNAPLASTAVSVVPPRQAGMASGINNTFRQVGIATGIAGLGAIFQNKIRSELHGSPAAKAVASGAVQQGGHAARVAFITGLNEILLVAAFVAFAGAVLGF